MLNCLYVQGQVTNVLRIMLALYTTVSYTSINPPKVWPFVCKCITVSKATETLFYKYLVGMPQNVGQTETADTSIMNTLVYR